MVLHLGVDGGQKSSGRILQMSLLLAGLFCFANAEKGLSQESPAVQEYRLHVAYPDKANGLTAASGVIVSFTTGSGTNETCVSNERGDVCPLLLVPGENLQVRITGPSSFATQTYVVDTDQFKKVDVHHDHLMVMKWQDLLLKAGKGASFHPLHDFYVGAEQAAGDVVISAVSAPRWVAGRFLASQGVLSACKGCPAEAVFAARGAILSAKTSRDQSKLRGRMVYVQFDPFYPRTRSTDTAYRPGLLPKVLFIPKGTQLAVPVAAALDGQAYRYLGGVGVRFQWQQQEGIYVVGWTGPSDLFVSNDVWPQPRMGTERHRSWVEWGRLLPVLAEVWGSVFSSAVAEDATPAKDKPADCDPIEEEDTSFCESSTLQLCSPPNPGSHDDLRRCKYLRTLGTGHDAIMNTSKICGSCKEGKEGGSTSKSDSYSVGWTVGGKVSVQGGSGAKAAGEIAVSYAETRTKTTTTTTNANDAPAGGCSATYQCSSYKVDVYRCEVRIPIEWWFDDWVWDEVLSICTQGDGVDRPASCKDQSCG
jgi:hypothetical protein